MSRKKVERQNLNSLEGFRKYVIHTEKADFMPHITAILKMYEENQQVTPAWTQAGGAMQPPTVTMKTGDGGIVIMTNPTRERLEEIGAIFDEPEPEPETKEKVEP